MRSGVYGGLFAGAVFILAFWAGRPRRQPRPRPETHYERTLDTRFRIGFWGGVVTILIAVAMAVNDLLI